MPSESYDIDTIERYLFHQMKEPELAKFQAKLQQDESLRQEVAAFRPVIEGFGAMRSENFRLQMHDWEEEWATDDTELIEWYLSGDLAGQAHRQIEQRIEQDETFAREVAAYREIQEGFGAVRTEAFISNIKEWEKEKAPPATSRRRALWPRLAAAAAILLLLGLGFNWYMEANFAAGAIAEASYQPPVGGSTMGGDAPDKAAITQRFEAAHRLFKQQQYPAAFQAFDGLLNELSDAPIDELSRTYYRENSEWSRLLAALPISTPPIDVVAETQRIASADGHEFQEPAQTLLGKLQSPLYRWVN